MNEIWLGYIVIAKTKSTISVKCTKYKGSQIRSVIRIGSCKMKDKPDKVYT